MAGSSDNINEFSGSRRDFLGLATRLAAGAAAVAFLAPLASEARPLSVRDARKKRKHAVKDAKQILERAEGITRKALEDIIRDSTWADRRRAGFGGKVSKAELEDEIKRYSWILLHTTNGASADKSIKFTSALYGAGFHIAALNEPGVKRTAYHVCNMSTLQCDPALNRVSYYDGQFDEVKFVKEMEDKGFKVFKSQTEIPLIGPLRIPSGDLMRVRDQMLEKLDPQVSLDSILIQKLGNPKFYSYPFNYIMLADKLLGKKMLSGNTLTLSDRIHPGVSRVFRPYRQALAELEAVSNNSFRDPSYKGYRIKKVPRISTRYVEYQSSNTYGDLTRFSNFMPFVNAKAREYGLDYRHVLAVMCAETAFRPLSTSWANAMGIMQVIPSTSRSVGVDPKHLYNIEYGTVAGCRVLAKLMQQFDGDMRLTSGGYLAGPRRARRYAYSSYANKIVRTYEKLKADPHCLDRIIKRNLRAPPDIRTRDNSAYVHGLYVS